MDRPTPGARDNGSHGSKNGTSNLRRSRKLVSGKRVSQLSSDTASINSSDTFSSVTQESSQKPPTQPLEPARPPSSQSSSSSSSQQQHRQQVLAESSRAVSDQELFPYLVRLAVLDYVNEPRFRSRGNDSALLSGTITPTHTRSRSANEIFGRAGAPPPSFTAKLPKDMLKLLQAQFRKIAVSEGAKKKYEPLLRRSLLAYYSLILSPEFAKKVKEDRRAEHLIMIFLSTAAKEISRSGEVPPDQLSAVLDSQAAQFVHLLIEIIKPDRHTPSQLIPQLQSYETSLRKSESLVAPITGGLQGMALNGADSTPKPTFEIEDMNEAKGLGSILLLSKSAIQHEINQTKNLATPKLALAELKYIEENLRNGDRHVSLHMSDFATEDSYTSWKTAELDRLLHLINHYNGKRPLATTVGLPSVNESNMYFIPPDTRAFFAHLLRRCLDKDSDPDKELLLSEESTRLLNQASGMWCVDKTSRAIILMDIATQKFLKSQFSLTNMYKAFELAKMIVTDHGKKEWNPSTFPICNYEHYVTALEVLTEHVMAQIKDTLSKVFQEKPPKLGPLLELLEDYVGVDYDTTPSPSTVAALKKTVEKAASDKYDAIIADIPRDHTLACVHIVDLADKIIALAKRIQKRYQFDVLDQISIPHIFMRVHLNYFADDSKAMFEYILQSHENVEFDDAIPLYTKLVEVRELYNQVSDSPFPYEIEAMFFPFVLAVAESAGAKQMSWVERALQSDNFDPEIDEQTYSSSIIDVFSAFRESIRVVAELNWQNEAQLAQIYTTLMKGIAAATCEYGDRILPMVESELKIERRVEVNSRSDKWLEMAKSAWTKTELTPYQFQRETCIKLNNLERAQLEIDRIEAEIDSEKQANSLGKKPKRGSNVIFTLRIVKAEGLIACDMNGLSDPYLVLVDRQTRSQIGKTRTIYEDVNPIWDETFEIVTSGHKWITATIWDENAIQSHDICGRATIELDPSKFEDFVAVDRWLDLDKQGRLLVNISMEAEREDIQFYFGKTLKSLMMKEATIINLIVGKFSPFITHFISTTSLKSLQGSKFANVQNTVSSWLNQGKPVVRPLTRGEILDSLNPLFDYLNDSFAILAQNLTPEMRIKVMAQTWTVVLRSVDSLLLPSLSDKKTNQQPLTAKESEIVFTWLPALCDFFHNEGAGPPLDLLRSEDYQDIMAVTVYHDMPTAQLMAESEKMSSASFKMMQERSYGSFGDIVRRSNTVMAHRNRSTIMRQREELRNSRRESARTEDVILRILRSRGEYGYVGRRLKQRESMARALATERLVQGRSLNGIAE